MFLTCLAVTINEYTTNIEIKKMPINQILIHSMYYDSTVNSSEGRDVIGQTSATEDGDSVSDVTIIAADTVADNATDFNSEAKSVFVHNSESCDYVYTIRDNLARPSLTSFPLRHLRRTESDSLHSNAGPANSDSAVSYTSSDSLVSLHTQSDNSANNSVNSAWGSFLRQKIINCTRFVLSSNPCNLLGNASRAFFETLEGGVLGFHNFFTRRLENGIVHRNRERALTISMTMLAYSFYRMLVMLIIRECTNCPADPSFFGYALLSLFSVNAANIIYGLTPINNTPNTLIINFGSTYYTDSSNVGRTIPGSSFRFDGDDLFDNRTFEAFYNYYNNRGRTGYNRGRTGYSNRNPSN